jgi:hypothetical protein
MNPKNLIKNWQQLLFGIGCITVGVLSLMYPDALGADDIQGRRALFKAIIVWVWGKPLGIAALLFGALAVWVSFLPDRE